ncbi:VWA domain-containing protein [Deinococcus hopiensis]|uniref:VWA domain-containing protein n=1 Tax=Deinococcus hopiensis TaxID=309885 RepID=UPI00111C71F1|nr:VWA domain-containing protein [Deinococcus hopiensis]
MTSALNVPPALLSALETAMEYSIQRLGKLQGQTAVFVDLSGSMYAPLSDRGTISRMDAACTLGGLIGRQVGCKVYAFGTYFKAVGLGNIPSALQAAQRIQKTEHEVGGGTYLLPAFEAAFARHFDRIVVLTDEQVADEAWSRLQRYLDADERRHAYVLNLAGYSASFAGGHPRLISVGGFSDRVLDWIAALEQPDPIDMILGHLPLKQLV